MTRYFHLIIGLLLVSSSPAFADEFDKSVPILCAMSKYYECDIRECEEVSADEIQAPTFFRVNAKKKTIQAIAGAKGKVSRIDEIEIVDDVILAVGVEDGARGDRDGVGYSLAITIDTGNLAFSAVTDDVAITGFGACIRD